MTRGLWRDERGGAEFTMYLILVALIALLALPGVRLFTASARGTFERSTTRYDRPGQYASGRARASGGGQLWGLQTPDFGARGAFWERLARALEGVMAR